MDSNGKCVGLLDIAKCLYDAVTRLGKAAKKKAADNEAGGDDGGSGSGSMIGAVMQAAKALKGKASAKSQRALQVPFCWLLVVVTVFFTLRKRSGLRGQWHAVIPNAC